MNETVTNFSHEDVSWSDHGAICIKANLLQRLFQPLVQKIIKVKRNFFFTKWKNTT